MALRATASNNLRAMTTALTGRRWAATSATTPKMKAYVSTVEQRGKQQQGAAGKGKTKGDYVPVYVALGLIGMAVALGTYTLKHQLMYAPGVRVKKSKRETVPEVVEPEHVAEESDRFVKNSFLRKVAHVQEFNTPHPGPSHKDVLTREPRVDSLKDVGVNPGALSR